VALADGTLVVEEDVPDGSLTSLADAIEAIVPAPYRAAALRTDDDVWSAVAEKISVVGLPGFEGEIVDLTDVDGVREVSVDGGPTTQSVAPLDALADEHGDVSIHAERVDGDLFAVDVFPL
jgi:hypothetical protein